MFIVFVYLLFWLFWGCFSFFCVCWSVSVVVHFLAFLCLLSLYVLLLFAWFVCVGVFPFVLLFCCLLLFAFVLLFVFVGGALGVVFLCFVVCFVFFVFYLFVFVSKSCFPCDSSVVWLSVASKFLLHFCYWLLLFVFLLLVNLVTRCFFVVCVCVLSCCVLKHKGIFSYSLHLVFFFLLCVFFLWVLVFLDIQQKATVQKVEIPKKKHMKNAQKRACRKEQLVQVCSQIVLCFFLGGGCP